MQKVDNVKQWNGDRLLMGTMQCMQFSYHWHPTCSKTDQYCIVVVTPLKSIKIYDHDRQLHLSDKSYTRHAKSCKIMNE